MSERRESMTGHSGPGPDTVSPAPQADRDKAPETGTEAARQRLALGRPRCCRLWSPGRRPRKASTAPGSGCRAGR